VVTAAGALSHQRLRALEDLVEAQAGSVREAPTSTLNDAGTTWRLSQSSNQASVL
jgi:hypothetical protein